MATRTLSDGTVVTGVPDNISTAELEERRRRGGAKERPPEGVAGSLTYGAQGALSGLLETVGAPVDLIGNYIVNPIGKLLGAEPQTGFLGGSAQLKGATNKMMQAAEKATGIGSGTATYVPQSIEQIPENYRPAYAFSRSVGSSLPFAAGVGLAARGVNLAAPAVGATAEGIGGALAGAGRQMAQEVARAPTRAAAISSLTQPAATVGAGVGAGLAQMTAPDSPVVGPLMELTGGVLGGGAGAALSRAADSAVRSGGALYQSVRPQSTKVLEGQAAKALAAQFAKAPEADTARSALENLRQAAPGTPAVDATRSGTIAGVSEFLQKSNPDLFNALAAQRARAEAQRAEELGAGMREAVQPGDTSALRRAADVASKEYFDRIDRLAASSRMRALETMEPVTPLSSMERNQANIAYSETIDKTLKALRNIESRLYDKINTQSQVGVDSTVRAFDEIRSTLNTGAYGDKMPDAFEYVRKFKKGLNKAKKSNEDYSVEYTELNRLRQRLGDDQASALAAGKINEARMLGDLRKAVADDIGNAGGKAAEEARSYTKEYHDRVSRTFLGDLIAKETSGAAAIPPGLSLEKTFAGTAPAVAEKLKAGENITTPIKLVGSAEEQAATLQAFQQNKKTLDSAKNQFLRSFSESQVDATTGLIKSPQQARNWMQKNAPILDRFPEYRDALKWAVENTEAVTNYGGKLKSLQKLAPEFAFSKIIQSGENISSSIEKALAGNSPAKDLSRLATFAQRQGPEAQAGFRDAFLSYITKSSTDNATGTVNYTELSKMLGRKISESPNAPTLDQALDKYGILSAEQASAFRRNVREGLSRDLSNVVAQRVEEFSPSSNMIARSLQRIMSLGALSRFMPKGPGSLSASQALAKASEHIMSNMPMNKVNDVMANILASETPEKLESVLEAAVKIADKEAMRVANSSSAMRGGVISAKAISEALRAERERRENPRPLDIRRSRDMSLMQQLGVW